MAVDTIGSISAAVATAQQSPRSEAREVKGAPDRDGDADDQNVQSMPSPAPTLNASGQVIGTLLNAMA